MRIVVDSSSNSFAYRNLGDLAMLRVALDRIFNLWPHASVSVITISPDRLVELFPTVTPVPPDGRLFWLQERNLLGSLYKLAPGLIGKKMLEWENNLRARFYPATRSIIESRFKKRNVAFQPMADFLEAIASADLLVLGGGGFVTDAFAEVTDRILDVSRLAVRMGVPVALMGQGLGPLCDRRLMRKFRDTMKGVVMLGLREKRASLPLLRSLGISTGSVAVTGDDALELAYQPDAQNRPLGNALGVNLRVSEYAGVDDRTLAGMQSAVRSIRAKYGALPVPVPVSHCKGESDVESIKKILAGIDDTSDGGAAIDTVEKLTGQISRCRVVITGSYHAAVFALAQGISVVAVLKSAYYADKFLGLAEMFGTGCYTVEAEGEDFQTRLEAAIDRAWQSADDNRPALLDAAWAQVEAGRQAYHRLRELVPGRSSEADKVPGATMASGAGVK